MIDRETWWQDKASKGRKLLDDIRILADRARAAGFTTTEYVLNLAATELTKDIERSNPQDRYAECVIDKLAEEAISHLPRSFRRTRVKPLAVD